MRRIAILMATPVLALTVTAVPSAHAETQIINTAISIAAPTATLVGDSHRGFYKETWSFSTTTLGPSPVLATVTGTIQWHVSAPCGVGGYEMWMTLDNHLGDTLNVRICLPDLTTYVNGATGRWAAAQGSTTAAKLTLAAPLDEPLLSELPQVPGVLIPYLSCQSQYDCQVADPFALIGTLTVTV